MIKIKKTIIAIAVLAFAYHCYGLSTLTGEDNFIIDNRVQEVEFFLDKDDNINARYSQQLTVESNSSVSNYYTNSIFVNDYSYLEEITYTANRRTRKIHSELTDYQVNGIFHSDTKVSYYDYQFEQKGAPVTFTYSKVFTDLKFLNKLLFGESYKVRNSSIIITIPEWLEADIIKWNFDETDITVTESQEGNTKVLRYEQADVEPVIKYRNEPNPSKTSPHLIIIAKSYTADGKSVRLMKETSDLYNWYHTLTQEVNDRPTQLESVVKDLLSNVTEDEEKIMKIYYWVQDNIKYIAFEDGIMGFKPEACQEVFYNKYGDCKGMANLTKNMLNIAGFDARLTWLGTNDIPYTYDMPSLLVDNHMICTVILDGKKIYLDATEKYSDLNTYAYRIEGKEVLIEDGEDYMIETIPVSDLEQNTESYNYKFSLDDNTLVGEGKMSVAGNRKTHIYNLINNYENSAKNDVVKSYISNGDKNISVDLLEDEINLDRNKDFTVVFQIDLDNHITRLADEIYLNMEFDNTYQNYKIDSDRTRDLDIGQRYYISATTKLEIPDGASVSYLPEAVNIENPKYEFSLRYETSGNEITYHKNLKLLSPVILVSEFESWNKAIKDLGDFYNDQIIFKIN